MNARLNENVNLGETFALLVNAVDEYAIFALDPKGHILTWNAGAERIKGYRSEEIIGSHFSRFYTKADIDRNHPAHELELAKRNGKYEEEGWRVRKDGTTFWASVLITALFDQNGELKGFGKITRDLTLRRQQQLALKESEERFRLLVSAVTDYALITLDHQGIVTGWNAGAERIKGYQPSEILGKHFSQFYPRSEIDSGKPEMELRIAREEGRYEDEGWRVRKDGTMFWANVVVTPILDENSREGERQLKGFAKVTRDLTARRQSEEALRQSQERYRLLVDSINDYGVILLDPNGRITSWNTGASVITGYDVKEILGSHVSRFYTKKDIQARKLELELATAIEQGRYEEEGIRVRKDGSEYWAKIVVTSVTDDTGNLRGFSKVISDITDKKKSETLLRQSEERFRLMIEGVADYAIFMLDPAGNVATWNLGAERNKGYSAEEIIGQHFSKFYPDEDKAWDKPAWELKEALKAGRFEDEGWRIRKDGSRFWANVVITPVYDGEGELLGFSKVTRNLTERKKAEEALREANSNLEERISQRTRELQDQKQRAENAVKVRDDFFSMASHELKTPLTALKLQTQLRKRMVKRGDFSDFSPENLPALLEEDDRLVDRLNGLIDRMLDITRLRSGKLRLSPEEFDLSEFGREVTNRMKPVLELTQNETVFTAEEGVIGSWDRLRIDQIITNLLTNAGKYAPGEPVHISVQKHDGQAVIKVKDHGKGIAREDQKRIFEPFERLKERSDVGGLGLGLNITKQLAEAHGGMIHVESDLGSGATFVVNLPISPPFSS